jgi:hypothetical protein
MHENIDERGDRDNNEPKNSNVDSDPELEIYGDDHRIASRDAKVPRWLKWSYILLPIWGLFWFVYFFNGSQGWLDRGYWGQLQKAALTTFPEETLQQEKQ